MANQDKKEVQRLKDALSVKFKMKNLSATKKILGIDIMRSKSKKKLFLSQKTYLEKVLHRFNMFESRAVGTPLGQRFYLFQ